MKGSKRARDSPSDESRPESDGENESQCDNKMRRSAAQRRGGAVHADGHDEQARQQAAEDGALPHHALQRVAVARQKDERARRNTLGGGVESPCHGRRRRAGCSRARTTRRSRSRSTRRASALGWKLLTPAEPHVVSRIGQKANLHAYAKELGMLEHLPQHYESPETASYPCMLEGRRRARQRHLHRRPRGGGPREGGGRLRLRRWLLQELCAGRHEYATSLLVKDGEILDAITTSYLYDKEIYVWPDVEEVRAFTAGTHSSCSRHNSPLTKCARRSLPP